MRKVTKGSVTIKMWDLGGQPRFRSLWERYCRGVQAIVYVVDAADAAAVDTATKVRRAGRAVPWAELVALRAIVVAISVTAASVQGSSSYHWHLHACALTLHPCLAHNHDRSCTRCLSGPLSTAPHCWCRARSHICSNTIT